MKIQRHHIPQHTPKWYEFRKRGYGASEIAAVLSEHTKSLQQYIYTSPIQVHLDKIGENLTRFSGNINSNAGHYMEGIIISMYKFWNNNEPDQMVMYANIADRKPQNFIKRCRFFMTNSLYPWLFFSPDALEYGQGGKGKPKGIIECKNTTSMEANRYPLGVSPSFLCQVVQGLIISNLEYARILIYIDGFKLQVVTIYREDEMVKKIAKVLIEDSYKSWRRVLECQMVKLQYGIEYYYQYPVDKMTAPQQEGVKILQQNEPEFTGSEREYEWIKENVHPSVDPEPMEGSQEQWDWLMERQSIKEQQSELEAKERLINTELIHSLSGFNEAKFNEIPIIQGGEVIPFDHLEKAYFSYKPNRNGQYRIHVSQSVKPYSNASDQ